MRNSNLKRWLVGVLAVIMVMGCMPVAMFASDFVSETHRVFSSTESTIAPGVTQKINYAYANDGKQMVYYVATADISRDDVMVQTSYYEQFENQSYGMSKLTVQMEHADKIFADPNHEAFISEHYKTVVGSNGDFYNMNTGAPLGAFVINGVQVSTKANGRPWFAIFEDGTALCGYNNTDWDAAVAAHGAVQQAVGGSQVLVEDGADVTATASGSYNTDRHCRTCVGVTADGKVVMMVLDGRQEPFSCGGTMHELAQIMLEAGCVMAINLDGGGSTTYASRPEGKNEVEVVNRPSDGSERAISNALIIASLAPPSDVFDRAVLTPENKIVTPESVVNIDAIGVSPAGTSADIPAEAYLQLADSSFGTIEGNVFTSNGTVGDAVIQMVYEGNVVGETTVSVVIPDLAFESSDMTVPYDKTFKLNVIGTTNDGANEVTLKDSDVVFELSDPAMGTIDGWNYTTCGEDSGITGGTVTVKCAYDETKTDTANITFGRASVIVEDFEDGNIDDWSVKSGYARSGNHLTFGRFESYGIDIVTPETGKVRNGNYAMKLLADFSTGSACGYKSIVYSFPAIDLTGATSFGLWMYLAPQDVKYLEFDIGGYEYYIADDANITEEGWYYIKAPVDLVGSSVSKFTIYMVDSDATYFNALSEFSIYIDDLTIDYSNATDDREIPYFTDVYLSRTADEKVSLNGQTISENEFSVSANAVENLTGNYTGLDVNSARVYVDGVLYTGEVTCNDNGYVIASDIVLEDGVHTFRFEIDDKAGNTGFITRQVVVNTEDSDISLVRRYNKVHPYAGAIEYFDVIAKNIEKVDSVTMTLDLDTLTEWELQGADVAYGFEMDYTVEDRSHTATVTITRTGDVEATGEAVLAALPVRIWATDSYLNQAYIDAGAVSNDPSTNEKLYVKTPAAMWQVDNTRVIRVEMKLESAVVEYTDGNTASFSGKQINVITENNRYRTEGYYDADGNYVMGDVEFCLQDKISTHVHIAGEPQDKAATCTEAGYTGRVFCIGCEGGAKKYLSTATEDVVCDDHVGGCESVIDWGTIIPATGHTYTVTDGVLKCACGKVFNGVYTDGKTYVDGIMLNGWVEDSYYDNGVLLTGIAAVDGVFYDFGEDGVSKGIYNGIVEIDGTYYYAKLGVLTAGWFDIDSAWYYFLPDTLEAANGSVTTEDGITFDFVDGKVQGHVWQDWFEYRLCWYGPSFYRNTSSNLKYRMVEIDGDIYFFNNAGCMQTGIIVSRESGAQEFFAYDCGTDGKGVPFTGVAEGSYFENSFQVKEGRLVEYEGNYYQVKISGVIYEAEVILTDTLTGVVFSSDGRIYYAEDGKIVRKGLVEVNGDIYYFGSDFAAPEDGNYYLSGDKLNGILSAGTYQIKDGKIVVNEGIKEEDGKLYYYKNNAKQKGAQKIGDDIYYFGANYYALPDGNYYIAAEFLNGLLPAGTYMIQDAKIVIKNGMYIEGDRAYYYENNKKVKAGVVEIDGELYYFGMNYYALPDGQYYIPSEMTNGIIPSGNYIIKDYKIHIKQGMYIEGDKAYYYVDNKKVKAGVVEIDGELYYFGMNYYALADGQYYLPAEMTNGLISAGNYIIKDYKIHIKQGMYIEGDKAYFYVDNKKVKGAQKIGEDIYYFGASYYALADGRYYIAAEFLNGLLPAGSYTIKDYKIEIKNGIVEEGGKLYFYENNMKVKGAQKIGEDIYYFGANYYALADGRYYIAEEFLNGLLPAGSYTIKDAKIVLA